MKARRDNKKIFEPVIVTLETQDEVDKLLAILIYSPIVETLDIVDWWESLKDYSSDNYDMFHSKLGDAFL